MERTADFVVIGAGIAGASVAAFLAPHGKTLLVERESHPGYHSTGRSAAMYMADYGSPQVRALTRASRAFFTSPPDDFADHAIVAARGVLTIASDTQLDLLRTEYETLRVHNARLEWIDGEAARVLVPVLRPEAVAAAILDPTAQEIDVDVLHQGYLRMARKAGAEVVTNADVTALKRDGATWVVETRAGRFVAPIVVNAAGAWADVVAAAAGVTMIGLVPKRRSAFTFDPPDGVSIEHWPMFLAVDESFYVKPDAGQLLASPANADPVEPHDVQAEELDVAIGIDRIQTATTLTIRRPKHVWAGLRSFVSDGGLVGGYAPDAPGFFWVAAQGGYGVQTSAAMGEACAALIRGENLPAHVAAEGLTARDLGPERLAATTTDNLR